MFRIAARSLRAQLPGRAPSTSSTARHLKDTDMRTLFIATLVASTLAAGCGTAASDGADMALAPGTTETTVTTTTTTKTTGAPALAAAPVAPAAPVQRA